MAKIAKASIAQETDGFFSGPLFQIIPDPAPDMNQARKRRKKLNTMVLSLEKVCLAINNEVGHCEVQIS
jgi:hypothetical protein